MLSFPIWSSRTTIKMNIFWYFGLICLSSMTVHSQMTEIEVPRREIRRPVCGRLLSDTLSLVCDGRYNEWRMKKDPSYNDMDSDYDDEPKWPFLSHQMANSLLSGNDFYRRNRRRVHDECCKKSCTLQVLQSYCSGPVPSK